MDTKRLFIGFLLNDDWKDAIEEFIEAQASPSVRWIPEPNWHITLLFIGDFSAAQFNDLITMLEAFFKSQKPFGIPFDTFVYAPNPKRPKMIWCKGATNPNFANITERTSKAFAEFAARIELPFQPEKRDEIIPHITLARLQLSGPPPPLRIPNAHSFPMPLALKDVHLFESSLKPTGAEYTLLQTFKLGSK
jgi:2'-5' RNA ligase